jgi:hypothetical protein
VTKNNNATLFRGVAIGMSSDPRFFSNERNIGVGS